MLALTRKTEEAIIINGNIEVKVLQIGQDKVKLGITAPKEVEIYREEIYVQVKQSNISAAKTSKEGIAAIKAMFK